MTPAESQLRRTNNEPIMYRGDRARILVVDDETALCRALTMALSAPGWDVVTTQSGEGAHTRLRDEHFDVLVLDLRIPDMRGDVIYHLATSLQPHLARATLFLTGDITERAEHLIAECSCPFLRKPFDVGDLIARVRALAPRRARETA
jgi:two-component system KDP operon response regulator KdpE